MSPGALRQLRIQLAGQRQRALETSRQRLTVGVLGFLVIAAVVAIRLVDLMLLPEADQGGYVGGFNGPAVRAAMVDRNGVELARTLNAYAVGIRIPNIVNDPDELAAKIAAIFPDLDAAELAASFKGPTRFRYIKRRVLPPEAQRLHEIGEPAIEFIREPERLYPHVRLASHVLGFANIDGEGQAGMELAVDDRLAHPETLEEPLHLSIDSRVQQALEHELSTIIAKHSALGGAGVVLDANTGEVYALASLPDYNPNDPGNADPEAMFNRATLGVFELGSTFKVLTTAMALDAGVVTLDKRYDATQPLKVGRFRINDDHPQNRWLTVPEVLIHSSNIGTAQMAVELGADRQQEYLRQLGLLDPVDIELHERGTPLQPERWGTSAIMTIGYGHGLAVSPLHLASAVAAVINGGVYRPATLMKLDDDAIPAEGRRVFSPETSAEMRKLMRLVVMKGTGRKADAPGYRVGGKTGTAEKAHEGGYARRRLVSTFAAAFPMDDPRFVIIVMVDEPKGIKETFGFATAGWTAAPVVKNVVQRIGPAVNILPDLEQDVDVSDVLPLIGTRGEG